MKDHINCPFCDDNRKIEGIAKSSIDDHLIVFVSGNQLHVHGPLNDRPLINTMVEAIEKEMNGKSEETEQRKITFRHKRALGDELMFTAGVRDFCLLFPDIRVNVEGNFPALWENNPYIDRTITRDTEGVEIYPVGYPLINNCNNASLTFHVAFLWDMISIVDYHKPLPIRVGEFTAAFANGRIGDKPQLETHLKDKYDKFCREFARQKADLHLTEEEKKTNIIKDIYGIEKYWVVAPGGKSDCTCKIWDWRRFQEVIDYFDDLLKFVVIGRSDHIVENLDNVIDLRDKFNNDIRGLLPLVYNAEGCVTGVSFLTHLAAAMPPRFGKEKKPCVTIYGGREPTTFTWYCNHQLLHTNGAFSCCSNGGCWQSRTIPLPRSVDKNKRLCHNPVNVDGRTIPSCMDVITAKDVIRAIEIYYEGDMYTYSKPKKVKKKPAKSRKVKTISPIKGKKEINILASLSSAGGGEQSALMIAKVLENAGWKVNFYPWDKIHNNYVNEREFLDPFTGEMEKTMVEGIPLLFYANDQIGKFCDQAQGIVDKSSSVIVGINYVNGKLPKCKWLHQTNKLKAVIFQNEEKRSEYERDRVGFENTKQIVLFGAIDLDKFLEACPKQRGKDEEFVILKHCTPDWRKYVTEQSARGGSKIHLWQKHIIKETDVKFYSRLLKDTSNTRFEFMKAHKELEEAFKGEPRMVFHEWNAMEVKEFLERGHLYLYRTSNHWRDNYPRVVAEALATGLPVLSEPRDGTKDRIVHGVTGFYCIDYDAFKYGIKLLQRKEKMRYAMCDSAKRWAKDNLNPKRWVDTIEDVLNY